MHYSTAVLVQTDFVACSHARQRSQKLKLRRQPYTIQMHLSKVNVAFALNVADMQKS